MVVSSNNSISYQKSIESSSVVKTKQEQKKVEETDKVVNSRLDDIKKQIDNGTYNLDMKSTAKAMLDELM